MTDGIRNLKFAKDDLFRGYTNGNIIDEKCETHKQCILTELEHIFPEKVNTSGELPFIYVANKKTYSRSV